MAAYRYPAAVLQLFARVPVPGQVKTRLIPLLGSQGACELHQRLLERSLLLCQAQQLAPAELWCDRRPLAGSLPALALPLHIQQGADLGARMAHAMDSAGQRAGRVLLFGSDIPGLDEPYLAAALEALDRHELVLGPARDGGYVLIGLRRSAPQLFQDISWGSSQVLAQTLARAAGLGLDYQLLETLADIDRPEDLALLRGTDLADLLPG